MTLDLNIVLDEGDEHVVPNLNEAVAGQEDDQVGGDLQGGANHELPGGDLQGGANHVLPFDLNLYASDHQGEIHLDDADAMNQVLQVNGGHNHNAFPFDLNFDADEEDLQYHPEHQREKRERGEAAWSGEGRAGRIEREKSPLSGTEGVGGSCNGRRGGGERSKRQRPEERWSDDGGSAAPAAGERQICVRRRRTPHDVEPSPLFSSRSPASCGVRRRRTQIWRSPGSIKGRAPTGGGMVFVMVETDLDFGRLINEGEEHDEDALRKLVLDIHPDELPTPKWWRR
uniref:Uncharacterized protein n=1 Tax=Oryza punctata TaxID=4537 RepID=A0A0E0LN90_ORYPU